MLDITEKLEYLEAYLNKRSENYAETFKAEILLKLEPIELSNPLLGFLTKLESFEDIENWVNRLLSRIVLKFDEEHEQLNDFIDDYLLFK